MSEFNIPQELQDLKRWAVWRLVDNKKDPFRANLLRVNASFKKHSHWTDYETALAAVKAGKADGLAFALADEYTLADFDTYKTEGEQKLEHEANVQYFRSHTYVERSQSGGGYHAIIRGATDCAFKSKAHHIDYFSDGFVYLTGDTIGQEAIAPHNTKTYLFEDYYSPAASEEAFHIDPEEDNSHLIDRLNYIQPENLSHAEWCMVGACLKCHGQPFEAFDAWSEQDGRPGKGYRGHNKTLKAWNDFKNPIKTTTLLLMCDFGVTISPDLAENVIQRNKKFYDTIPVPILDALQQDIYKRQHDNHHGLAQAIALSLASVPAARNYVGKWTRAPACFFIGIIAMTGLGKEIAYLIGNQLYRDHDELKKRMINLPKSGSGLFGRLQRDPSTTFVVDELGLLLASNNPAEQEVMKDLMQFYGRSESIHYGHSYSSMSNTEKAVEKAEEGVAHPAINMLATTTWETLSIAMQDVHIFSGLINRFIFLDASHERARPNRYPCSEPLGEEYRDRVDALMSGSIPDALNQRLVEHEAGAEETLWQYKLLISATTNRYLIALRKRRYENALRMCNVLAAWNNPDTPIITNDIARWVVHYLEEHNKRIELAIMTRKHDDRFDNVVGAVLTCLEEHRGRMKLSELVEGCSLFKNFRLDNKQSPKWNRQVVLDEMQDTLEMIEVNVDMSATSKRKPTYIELV